MVRPGGEDGPGLSPRWPAAAEFSVSLNISEACQFCGTENMVQVRAILSWEGERVRTRHSINDCDASREGRAGAAAAGGLIGKIPVNSEDRMQT
jgi:hypothetical protein